MTAPSESIRPRFTAADRGLLGLSLVCGIAYFLLRGLPVGVVVKGLSVSPLALIALRHLKRSDGVRLGGALLLSALGDLFLALPGEQWFVYGLGSFLIAHLFYITLFVRNWPRPFAADLSHRAVALLLLACAAGMFAWLWPSLGEMRPAVAAYLCALTGMAVTATLAGFRSWWVVAGAALFMLSDSLIAIGKFKSPVVYGDTIIWATYYAAQVLIALGFIGERWKSTSDIS
ncbi:MAG TPA: lysoplasmalogenase [Blastocatellia bacterium]|nr:lysoplasmalogenase [Blastocatellia bacterium]